MPLRFNTLCSLALSLALGASALRAESSVWKVTRGGQTVYLGGTCHLLRAKDLPLPAEFDQAFAASKALYFETDIARAQSPEMQQIVLEKGVFGDGKTLEKVLTPAAWKAVQAYCQKNGLPLAQLQSFKPWLFAMTLAVVELQKLGVSMEGVDVRFHARALKDGKKVGELETFEKHLSFITNLGAGHESEMVAQSIDDLGDLPTKIDELLTAWKQGNLTKVEELMLSEMREKYPDIFKELIVSRNNAWLPKIDEMLKTPEVELVLVGVGHMAGKEGLIAQLKAKGCAVEQVKAAAPAAK